MDESSDCYREKRSSVYLRALIDRADGSAPGEHRVRNISVTGACVEHEGELLRGAPCRVRIGIIPEFESQIVWANGRLAGLRFSRPVDLDAARKPRGQVAAPTAGWIIAIDSPYRR